MCKAANVTQDKIDTYLNAYTKAISLEESYDKNENSMNYSEIIEDKKSNLVEKIENEELKYDILSAVNILKDREKEVITMRFGLNENAPDKVTLEEIGNIYGVTKECIRQIEKKALSKIYNSDFCRQLLNAYVS